MDQNLEGLNQLIYLVLDLGSKTAGKTSTFPIFDQNTFFKQKRVCYGISRKRAILL